MGGFEQAAIAVLGAVQSHRKMRTQDSALVARQQVDAQRLDLARKSQERDKRNRLAQTQATQRARFAAAGVGRGGSADALLNGLAQETEQSIRDDLAGDRLRRQQGAGATARARKSNLLEYQRAQRQRATGLGRGVSLLEP